LAQTPTGLLCQQNLAGLSKTYALKRETRDRKEIPALAGHKKCSAVLTDCPYHVTVLSSDSAAISRCAAVLILTLSRENYSSHLLVGIVLKHYYIGKKLATDSNILEYNNLKR
jgi:hypothetical protein